MLYHQFTNLFFPQNCRRCQDCGSITPGSGATSRWHLNYSVCDSCYQQRNKGLSCPLCGKAYRQFTDVPMAQCTKCEKCVHIECDEAAEELTPYKCTNCRMLYKDEVSFLLHFILYYMLNKYWQRAVLIQLHRGFWVSIYMWREEGFNLIITLKTLQEMYKPHTGFKLYGIYYTFSVLCIIFPILQHLT